MTDNFKTKFIVNPQSSNGRTGKFWPDIQASIKSQLPEFDFDFTSAPHDATKIAAASLKSGYEMIVCIGGDGTINETINGFFEDGKPIRTDAVLGVLCMGTGGDFVKTAGIPKDFSEALPILAGRNALKCDAGHITLCTHSGEIVDKYFLNITDFGMGGDVVYHVNNSSKALKGKLPFLMGMLKSQIYYRNKTVRFEIDGKDIGVRKIKNAVIANGRYFGGGMKIAKNARLDDGLFDVIIMGDLTILDALKWVKQMYTGDIIDFKEKVEYFKAKQIRATSDQEVLIDMDGEQPGKLPIKLTILPGAIRIKTRSFA